MSHPYFHARSSARKFGGEAADYLAVHEWFDQAHEPYADPHRAALLHSSLGILLCEQVFGPTITRRSDGMRISTRRIAEQHVLEHIGRIPTPRDWLDGAPHVARQGFAAGCERQAISMRMASTSNLAR